MVQTIEIYIKIFYITKNMKKIKPQLYVNQLATVKEGKVFVVKWVEDKETGDKHAEYTEIPSGRYMKSIKFDGVRGVITGHSIESRSKATLPNDNLYTTFKHLMDWCKENNCILDGEFYSHDVDFGEVIGVCMTKGTKKPIPDSFFFHCFDCIPLDDIKMSFENRFKLIPKLDRLEIVEQQMINIPEDSESLTTEFKQRLDEGFEGLMIRGAEKPYKFGRSTPTCGTGYKFKLYETHDAKILGVQQATIVDAKAEKKINELGRSVTSKKKGDRVLIESASGFECVFEGEEFVVNLGLSDERKKEIWENKEKYIGEFCEFKAMPTTKDAPRNPNFLRMRWKEQDE